MKFKVLKRQFNMHAMVNDFNDKFFKAEHQRLEAYLKIDKNKTQTILTEAIYKMLTLMKNNQE